MPYVTSSVYVKSFG
jgi:hypothetical protein